MSAFVRYVLLVVLSSSGVHELLAKLNDPTIRLDDMAISTTKMNSSDIITNSSLPYTCIRRYWDNPQCLGTAGDTSIRGHDMCSTNCNTDGCGSWGIEWDGARAYRQILWSDTQCSVILYRGSERQVGSCRQFTWSAVPWVQARRYDCMYDTITYTWNPGPWTSCSSACTQVRNVTCKRSDGHIVDESNCSGSKPSTSQSCTGGDCTFEWKTEAWSACSIACVQKNQAQAKHAEVKNAQPLLPPPVFLSPPVDGSSNGGLEVWIIILIAVGGAITVALFALLVAYFGKCLCFRVKKKPYASEVPTAPLQKVVYSTKV
eukprot:scaffold53_cov381-Pavlova_lutheri.AAC.14